MGGVIPLLEVNGQQLVQEIDMAIEEMKTAYFRVQHDKQEMPITHTEHTKSNEDKADKTMSRIHRKASPCQHRVLGPNAKDQKAQELESLIRNLVRIPATSRM